MTSRVCGDADLAAKVGGLLGPRHPVFAAATITPAGTTVTSQGSELDADFEIASLSKGVTGLLYVDALGRGDIERDTTLGELLPLDDAPARRVRLDSLSTHRSGLPGLPRSAHPLRRTLVLWRHGANPYGESLEQLLVQARGVTVGRPRPRYSNFGFELLGHAIAAAAGTRFSDLVADRFAAPLNLKNLYVPATPAELRPLAVTGQAKGGRPREPWTGEALGPAGGIRASIHDMATLVAALLDDSAPGARALDPIAPFGSGTRIGAGWVTTELDGRDVTWHNGGSGGFRSWLGLDRTANTGAVILSATSASIDRHGFALLAELS